jgi:aspartyl-tRNA(Asn)/glutamyl-tRNA(Gln) amidotransferase subunit C
MPKGDKKTLVISDSDVKHVAALANIPLDPSRLAIVKKQLEESLEYVRTVQTLDLDDIPETVQISGLQNVMREDVVDTAHMLTQKQALFNAPKQHQGYFVVKSVMEE